MTELELLSRYRFMWAFADHRAEEMQKKVKQRVSEEAKDGPIPMKEILGSMVPGRDHTLDVVRSSPLNVYSAERKIDTRYFDVFLCHNSVDKASVKVIGEKLKQHGLLPWLDEWELPPGRPWQVLLEKQISQIRSAAVFVGLSGVGPWQDLEIRAFLSQFAKRECPVIPIILPDCREVPQLPLFLTEITWIDFRKLHPDPIEQLLWGIRGTKLS